LQFNSERQALEALHSARVELLEEVNYGFLPIV
jgi:hypothetical protein